MPSEAAIRMAKEIDFRDPADRYEDEIRAVSELIDQAADEKYAKVVREAVAVLENKCYDQKPSARERLREALKQIGVMK